MRLFSLFFIAVVCCSYSQRTDFESIHFKKADSIALQYKNASLQNLPVLTHNLTANLTTEVEKFRAIYTWVCTTIENDYSGYLKTRKKRKKILKDREKFLEWNTDYTPKMFAQLIAHKKTACTGYAYLIKEMASLAGLQSEIVNGYGRTPTLTLEDGSIPNHSWNAVFLNSTWYLCDATWSAGRVFMKEDGPKFEADYFDGYFLAEPSLFAKNHYPLDLKWLLLEQAPSFTDFLEGPIIYKEAFTYNLVPIFPSKMNIYLDKNESINFKLKTHQKEFTEKIGLQITSGKSKQNFSPETNQREGIISINHHFTKTGRFDVHLKVNEDILATYVVVVKRDKKATTGN